VTEGGKGGGIEDEEMGGVRWWERMNVAGGDWRKEVWRGEELIMIDLTRRWKSERREG
jgi:hypothetical protein